METTPPVKPTLVLLHYFGGAAASWQWLIKGIGSEYNCVAINLPGFGGAAALSAPNLSNMASFVIDYVNQHVDTDSYILAGHSMGGKIAMEVAYLSKSTDKRVQQLILLAPSPPTIEKMPDAEKQRMLIHPNYNEAVTTVANGTVIKLEGAILETAIATQLQADPTTWNWWINDGMNESIATHAKDLKIPVTLIVSKDDPAITQQMTTDETIPNLPASTHVVWTEGIGHLFQLENPEWLAKTLSGVIK
ncbi:alpha/beta fold hydrolase [Mucilaginibacter aquatilis]|uniref:Alpha/beta fold hydrolase n=1 Tax=Mucilaginibacter aquatilis TaxID=1517760 RepID=A0A6I4IRG4_9SPHI|nr:alpha/beta hydrolase [Mucilaginibacter aquatilis]MVN92834.1 alpha/beta fold hydrolase [Mucilaginibacter aquatilis]